jgi:hypothetical protein
MWHIPVRYPNDTEDIVPPFILDQLISSAQINQFYRPSENRWVTLGLDQMRKTVGTHTGPERRRPICTRITFP